YIVDALQIYGQADVPVRGLMFCSRRDEAHRLSELFNQQFNQQAERLYRTRAIDGGTPQNERQQAIDDLENGRLDYLLTVDLFNEGIDIPSINQIVMLRQTESSIIFTQQLGRGLRWTAGKDSVVVIDFIGNYATNYLIPIALYGNTGDRDRARRNMQRNVIGLSSISFDPIAQKKVLESLATADLSNMTLLTDRYRDLRFELNRIPLLMDIQNHDPSLVTTMAMKSRNYLAFVRSREASLGRKSTRRDMWLPGATTPEQEGVLTMLTAVLLRGLRPHEALALAELCGMPRDADGDDMTSGRRRLPSPVPIITDRGVAMQELHDHLASEFPTADDSDDQWHSALSVLEYTYFTAPNRKRFRNTPVIHREENDRIRLTDTLIEWIRGNDTFRTFFLDTLRASLANAHGLLDNLPRKDISACGFIRGEKYGIFDVMRLCGWSSEQVAQNVGGYRLDLLTSTLPIFIKYATSQYEDRFLDPSRILWYSKNNRNLRSPEYQWLLDGTQGTSAWTGTHIVPVFIRRKAETNETGYYFVGMASHIADAHESVNRHEGTNNRVVISTLTLDRPVPPDLLEHLTGTRTF
uniref:DUF3427 domain-containing protein n=1 Tax=uncultured Bifidobacterium sp. TaxID=165187 RepID=UPI0028DC89BB